MSTVHATTYEATGGVHALLARSLSVQTRVSGAGDGGGWTCRQSNAQGADHRGEDKQNVPLERSGHSDMFDSIYIQRFASLLAITACKQ